MLSFRLDELVLCVTASFTLCGTSQVVGSLRKQSSSLKLLVPCICLPIFFIATYISEFARKCPPEPGETRSHVDELKK